MKKWKYKVEKVGGLGGRHGDIEQILNELGEEWWEVVAVCQINPGVYTVFLKREVAE